MNNELSTPTVNASNLPCIYFALSSNLTENHQVWKRPLDTGEHVKLDVYLSKVTSSQYWDAFEIFYL